MGGSIEPTRLPIEVGEGTITLPTLFDLFIEAAPSSYFLRPNFSYFKALPLIGNILSFFTFPKYSILKLPITILSPPEKGTDNMELHAGFNKIDLHQNTGLHYA